MSNSLSGSAVTPAPAWEGSPVDRMLRHWLVLGPEERRALLRRLPEEALGAELFQRFLQEKDWSGSIEGLVGNEALVGPRARQLARAILLHLRQGLRQEAQAVGSLWAAVDMLEILQERDGVPAEEVEGLVRELLDPAGETCSLARRTHLAAQLLDFPTLPAEQQRGLLRFAEKNLESLTEGGRELRSEHSVALLRLAAQEEGSPHTLLRLVSSAAFQEVHDSLLEWPQVQQDPALLRAMSEVAPPHRLVSIARYAGPSLRQEILLRLLEEAPDRALAALREWPEAEALPRKIQLGALASPSAELRLWAISQQHRGGVEERTPSSPGCSPLR